MRVAVLLNPGSQFTGGAFSYSKLITDELNNNQGFDNLEFVFFKGHNLCEIDEASSQQKVRASLQVIKDFYNRTHSQFNIRPPRLLIKLKRVISRLMLNKKLKESEIDFVWSTFPLTFALDIPYATTIWDLQHRQQPFWPEVSSRGRWRAREEAFKESIQRATFVIVGTKEGASEVSQFYAISMERILVAPFPISADLDSPSIRDPQIIFYPAQFWAHKNHVNLIKGLKLAVDISGKDFHLILPGIDKGNQKYIISQSHELQLTKHVSFPGFISANELYELYRKACLMIFPSYFGPDNLPPLEGIANGCPVATANVPGAHEQLGESVRYFDPNSASEICEIILHASNFPRLTEVEMQARQEIIANRNPKKSISIILESIENFSSVRENWESSKS
jgi:glycosyltransferase involved in cell wall biosynthesis